MLSWQSFKKTPAAFMYSGFVFSASIIILRMVSVTFGISSLKCSMALRKWITSGRSNETNIVSKRCNASISLIDTRITSFPF